MFCFLIFGYQYQCNWLPWKICLQDDQLCVEWDVKPYTLTHSHKYRYTNAVVATTEKSINSNNRITTCSMQVRWNVYWCVIRRSVVLHQQWQQHKSRPNSNIACQESKTMSHMTVFQLMADHLWMCVFGYACTSCFLLRDPMTLIHELNLDILNMFLRLWSSFYLQLVVRPMRLSTVGDRALPVAGSCLWNSLPPDVTPAPMLTVFRNCLKTCRF